MTKKDIEKKAKEWIENNFMYWDFLTPHQKVFLRNAFVEFAEKIIKEVKDEITKDIIEDCYTLLEEVFMLKKRDNEHAIKVMEKINEFYKYQNCDEEVEKE